MSAPDDHTAATRDANAPVFGPVAPAEDVPVSQSAPQTARQRSAATRAGLGFLIIAGIAAAVLIAVRAGAITLPGTTHGTGTPQTTPQASPAATRAAANQQWASAMCTDILQWKSAIKRDATSLDLGFGVPARVKDAITTTMRTLSELDKLGLPPGAEGAQGRAETNQLRSRIASRVMKLQDAARSLASGNLGAAVTLLGDLKNDTVTGAQVVNELQHVLSVDLGISLVETRACRQLVGIPV
jgi:hypothetical protein